MEENRTLAQIKADAEEPEDEYFKRRKERDAKKKRLADKKKRENEGRERERESRRGERATGNATGRKKKNASKTKEVDHGDNYLVRFEYRGRIAVMGHFKPDTSIEDLKQMCCMPRGAMIVYGGMQVQDTHKLDWYSEFIDQFECLNFEVIESGAPPPKLTQANPFAAAMSRIGDSNRKQILSFPGRDQFGNYLCDIQPDLGTVPEVEELFMACKRGNLEKVKEIVGKGDVDLNVVVGAHESQKFSPAGRSLVGKTAAQIAAFEGRDACLEFLLKSKASPLRNEDEVMSPIFSAIAGQSPDIIVTLQILLEAKADVNELDDVMETNTVHHAIEYLGLKKTGMSQATISWDVIPFLLSRNADHVREDYSGFTPLAKAARWGDLKTTKLLLKNGVPASTMSASGASPLSTACKFGYSEIAASLIDAKARIDAEAYYQAMSKAGHRTISAQTGQEKDHSPHDPSLLALLNQKGGAGVEEGKSGDGATVLHVAASENNLAVAELCIEQNAPLDARTQSGMSPLMLCARHGGLSVAKKLLDTDAKLLDSKDNEGNSVLHYTWWDKPRGKKSLVGSGNIVHNAKMFEYLTETWGASKDVKNNAGYKPEMPLDGKCPIM